jgi:hypothetical protein
MRDIRPDGLYALIHGLVTPEISEQELDVLPIPQMLGVRFRQCLKNVLPGNLRKTRPYKLPTNQNPHIHTPFTL